jgi:hypothetical protein
MFTGWSDGRLKGQSCAQSISELSEVDSTDPVGPSGITPMPSNELQKTELGQKTEEWVENDHA